MECLGHPSWMPWESSGISEIARATNVRFSYFWTDDPTGRSVGLIHYDTFSNTIRSDGDYPLEGIPLRLHPTIRFGMAVDAINVSRTTYLTVVRYYLANLETTMESQVRSSVFPVSLDIDNLLCTAIHCSSPSPLSCASLCAAHSLLVPLQPPPRALHRSDLLIRLRRRMPSELDIVL